MSMTPSSGVTLPPGVSISASRETTQLGANGQPVNGMVYQLTLPSGAQTSVFVPYSVMNNLDLVSQMFAERVNAIHGVLGLGK